MLNCISYEGRDGGIYKFPTNINECVLRFLYNDDTITAAI